MTEDEIRTEIAANTASIDTLMERNRELRRFLEFPYVTPVEVYFRYHSRYEDEATVWGESEQSPLEQSYQRLAWGLDDGDLSPVGVLVGGYMHDFDDLRERFGEVC